MCCASSDDYSVDPVGLPPFEEVQGMVESEFDVEEGFVDHNVPTFYVRYREDSKEAFLRLMKRLDALELLPLLRPKEEKVVLKVLAKPSIKPNRNIINIALFFATLGTVFVSGYFLSSSNILGALLFTGAIMAILGTHEMGHKLLADKHDVDATYPYFIPGLPFPYGIGTFGALIRQKALPPKQGRPLRHRLHRTGSRFHNCSNSNHHRNPAIYIRSPRPRRIVHPIASSVPVHRNVVSAQRRRRNNTAASCCLRRLGWHDRNHA